MNLASLMIFNINRHLMRMAHDRGGKLVQIALAYDDQQRYRDVTSDVKRMLGAWTHKVSYWDMPLRNIGSLAGHPETCIALLADKDVGESIVRETANAVILPMVPEPNELDFGFFQEFESHDYELGGLNEWNGSPTAFSPAVLQTLSLVHCRKSFPEFLRPEITALPERSPNRIPTALDIGCGPISRLRSGAVEGLFDIIGVDPLNDLYDAVLIRHGLNGLPHIRPVRTYSSVAESVDFGGELFDFVYSNNALDHTQNLAHSLATIRRALSPSGLACIIVNTCEGRRQGYAGLHKYDIWHEGGEIWYASMGCSKTSLLTGVGDLEISRIIWSNDDNLCFTLTVKGR